MLPLITLEPRVGAAVLNGGGITSSSMPPDLALINYLPRVTQPVLMLNGRWDYMRPLASQEAMFRLLGTPVDQKQHLVFDEGHGVLPVRPAISAMLDFFDRYLGATVE